MEIRIVLLHYAGCDEYPVASQAYTAAINRLISHDILTPETKLGSAMNFSVTDKGKVLVKMWCETPLPVEIIKWSDPRFDSPD